MQAYCATAVLKSVPSPPPPPPPPQDMIDGFERHVKKWPSKQRHNNNRVSDNHFVIQEEQTCGNTLGKLHVRVNGERQCYCTCSRLKRMTSLFGATTAPDVSRKCSYIYLFLWAVFSNDTWNNEVS